MDLAFAAADLLADDMRFFQILTKQTDSYVILWHTFNNTYLTTSSISYNVCVSSFSTNQKEYSDSVGMPTHYFQDAVL